MKNLLIIMSLLLMACNSVKKAVNKSNVVSDSIHVVKEVTKQDATEIAQAGKSEDQSATILEVETPEGSAFPENADTTIQIVKILKSLPPGSKVKQTTEKKSVVDTSKTVKQTAASTTKADSGRVTKKVTIVEKQKQTSRMPIALIGGGVILLAITIGLYYVKSKRNA